MIIISKDRLESGVVLSVEFEAGDRISDLDPILKREISHCEGAVDRNVRVDFRIVH